MSQLDDFAERLAAIEDRLANLKVSDLPLAPLQRKLEADWQPNGAVLLEPGSVTSELLGPNLPFLTDSKVQPGWEFIGVYTAAIPAVLASSTGTADVAVPIDSMGYTSHVVAGLNSANGAGFGNSYGYFKVAANTIRIFAANGFPSNQPATTFTFIALGRK